MTTQKVNAQIREGLAAAERGETVDLGSFAQYAEPVPVTITYDAQAEAGYIYLGPTDRPSARTKCLDDTVWVDYDEHGNVIGVELLGVAEPHLEGGG